MKAADRPAPVTAYRRSGRPLRVALLGFGTVGRSVARILSDGLHPELALSSVFSRHIAAKRVDWLPDGVVRTEAIEDVFASDADAVVEVVGGREPARSWIARALEQGRAVVTANKQVVAHHGPELFEIANAAGAPFLFEAAVGGGIPIVRALETGLAGDDLQAVTGILNGTCNYILTRMEISGAPLAEALEEAQRQGYAEADPTDDLDGADAAAKLAILAMIGLRIRVPPEAVAARSIRCVDPADFHHLRAAGATIRQIARVAKSPEASAAAGPAVVPIASPFARVRGSENLIAVRGRFGGDTLFAGRGAGGDPTAVAVVSDLLSVARGTAVRARHVPPPVHPETTRTPGGAGSAGRETDLAAPRAGQANGADEGARTTHYLRVRASEASALGEAAAILAGHPLVAASLPRPEGVGGPATAAWRIDAAAIDVVEAAASALARRFGADAVALLPWLDTAR